MRGADRRPVRGACLRQAKKRVEFEKPGIITAPHTRRDSKEEVARGGNNGDESPERCT
jgi:hypothetical protein